MEWDSVQFAIFDPPVNINTTFIHNGPSYNVKGVEAQFIARPYEGVTIQGSGSYNHDTQSSAPCLVSNLALEPDLRALHHRGQGAGRHVRPLPEPVR